MLFNIQSWIPLLATSSLVWSSGVFVAVVDVGKRHPTSHARNAVCYSSCNFFGQIITVSASHSENLAPHSYSSLLLLPLRSLGAHHNFLNFRFAKISIAFDLVPEIADQSLCAVEIEGVLAIVRSDVRRTLGVQRVI